MFLSVTLQGLVTGGTTATKTWAGEKAQQARFSGLCHAEDKGDWTKQSEWLGLEKAAGNQPLLLEIVHIVTEVTYGLVVLVLCASLLLISNPPHLWGQEIDSGPLRIKVTAWPYKSCTVQAGDSMGRHSCAPAPSQEVSACAVKCYPNSLPPLSASALLPIIWFPFSELLLRLQDVNQWDVVQVDSRTQVRWWGRRGAMAGWLQWEPTRDSGRCPAGWVQKCLPLLLQISIQVSCPRPTLSLMKGKQKGESEKEFLT